jgi:tetratricopeptide (TPR) repeat protein
VAAAVLPVSGIVPFKGQNFSTVADRYFYLAMPGVALGVALVTQRFARSRWFWAISIAILIMLGGLNLRQQAVWRNDLTLFGHIVQQYPGQPRVHNNYGVALQAAGRHEAAIQQFSTAIQQRPTYSDPYCNRGSSLGRMGRLEEAYRDQSRAMELDSADGGCAYNRAVTQYRMGRFRDALADIERARELGYAVPAVFEASVRRRRQIP